MIINKTRQEYIYTHARDEITRNMTRQKTIVQIFVFKNKRAKYKKKSDGTISV